MDIYTLLYFEWAANRDLLYSTGNSTQCYMAVWVGGSFGGEWIHVDMWPSPFAGATETIATLLVRYTPTQN